MQERKEPYDVIVVGAGGLFGASAFYNAAKIADETVPKRPGLFTRPKVLGLEQFEPNHTNGSSHGESRITRVATGEGPEYVQLAARSNLILQEVAQKTKEVFGKLCYLIGGLIIASDTEKGAYHGSKEGFLQQTRKCATQFDIPHRNLSAAEMRKEFSPFKIEDHESAYFEEKTMGYINPDACIKAQLQLAREHGGELRTSEKLIDFSELPGGKVKVITEKAGARKEYVTNKLILNTGAWAPEILKDKCSIDLKVYRQTVYWFEVEDEKKADFTAGKFVPFIWDGNQKGIVYGFPIMEKEGKEDKEASKKSFIKIGSEKFFETTTPNTVVRTVSEDEEKEMYEKFIKPRFNGISPRCHKKMVCLYTVAPGHRFVIDYLPDFKNKVIVVSACSGHGAKHSAAVGEAVAQLSLLGKADIDVIKLFGGLKAKIAADTATLKI